MKARKSSSTLLRYNSVVTLFDKLEVVALSQPEDTTRMTYHWAGNT